MNFWKGGRGKKAPYETAVIRVPLPVKQKVEAIVEIFQQEEKEKQEKAEIFEEEMVEIANSILAKNKSVKASLETFLLAILDKEISL